MTDYEKGSAAWDIGQILTRHRSRGPGATCAKVIELLLTTPSHGRFAAEERIYRAWRAPCTCGAGHSLSEHTSEDRVNEYFKSLEQEAIHADAGSAVPAP